MLSIKEVKHIARLSKLELTEKEIERFRSQLSAILDYVAILNEVDTSKIKATTHAIAETNRFQEGPKKTLSLREILKNAKKTKGRFIVVEESE